MTVLSLSNNNDDNCSKRYPRIPVQIGNKIVGGFSLDFLKPIAQSGIIARADKIQREDRYFAIF